VPSGGGLKLSLVLTPTVLRLSALVAVSMSAGYLWRAAVDTSGPGTSLLVVPPAATSELAEVPFNSLDLLRPARVEDGTSVRARQVTRRVQRSARRARTAQFVSVTGAGQARHSAPPAARPSTPPAKTKPTNGGRRPKPPPPAPPAQPPPPAPPAPPAPPPPPPPPVEPPPPPPAGGETRPGRGRGDRNHRHTGPPGQEKRKRAKEERRGGDEHEGGDRGSEHGEQGERGPKGGRKEKGRR
jgi:hypothetical protein